MPVESNEHLYDEFRLTEGGYHKYNGVGDYGLSSFYIYYEANFTNSLTDNKTDLETILSSENKDKLMDQSYELLDRIIPQSIDLAVKHFSQYLNNRVNLPNEDTLNSDYYEKHPEALCCCVGDIIKAHMDYVNACVNFRSHDDLGDRLENKLEEHRVTTHNKLSEIWDKM